MGFRVLSKEEGFGGGEIAAFLMGAQNVTEICFMRASLVCLYVDRRWRRKRVFGGDAGRSSGIPRYMCTGIPA